MKYILTILAIITISLVTITYSEVNAHEGRDSGTLRLTVGWIEEPAFEGLRNGVSLQVMQQISVDQPTNEGHTDHSQHHNESHADHAQHESHTSKQESSNEHTVHSQHHNESHSPNDQIENINVEAHGALFVSPALASGESFSYIVGAHLSGKTLPYHSHLDHSVTGSLLVTDNHSTPKTIEVEIIDNAYNPPNPDVNPGDTVVWINRGNILQNVTSGLMGSPDTQAVKWEPVEGLESQLEVELTHLASGISKVFSLRPIPDEPGHYTTDVIPTSPGQYAFRFFGTILDQPFNERFESGDGRFDHVQAADVIQFPEALPSIRELEGAVRGAKLSAEEALNSNATSQDDISNARRWGIIGGILGLIGTIFGIVSIYIVLRKT